LRLFRFDSLSTLQDVFPDLDLTKVWRDYVDASDSACSHDAPAVRFHQLFWADILWGAFRSGAMTRDRFLEDLEKVIPLSARSEVFALLVRAAIRIPPPKLKPGRPSLPSQLKEVAKALERLIKRDEPAVQWSDLKVREEVGRQFELLGGMALLSSADLRRLLDHRVERNP
jgi:hypothetical protein